MHVTVECSVQSGQVKPFVGTTEKRTSFFFITLFRYLIFLFYSFHCLSFPSPKGCILEKGHIVPLLSSQS